MSRLGFYEVGKSGATIRSEPSLCSAKVGRASAKSLVYVVRVVAVDGVERCELGGDEDACAHRSGWDGCVELLTRRDCEGQPWGSRHCTWFYFSVADERPGAFRPPAKLRILTASRQGALFRHGYRPVVRPGSGARDTWARSPRDPAAGAASTRKRSPTARCPTTRATTTTRRARTRRRATTTTTPPPPGAGRRRPARRRWKKASPSKAKKKKPKKPRKKGGTKTKCELEWTLDFGEERVLDVAFGFPYSCAEVDATSAALDAAYGDDPDILFKREVLTRSLEGGPSRSSPSRSGGRSGPGASRASRARGRVEDCVVRRGGGEAWGLSTAPPPDDSGGDDDDDDGAVDAASRPLPRAATRSRRPRRRRLDADAVAARLEAWAGDSRRSS
ncbi:hypothetical protein JL720_16914 [Aureococcus anophagefferens]|nr:hypothetical protein JL720_16914 [Aureococcus anophagefferens]